MLPKSNTRFDTRFDARSDTRFDTRYLYIILHPLSKIPSHLNPNPHIANKVTQSRTTTPTNGSHDFRPR